MVDNIAGVSIGLEPSNLSFRKTASKPNLFSRLWNCRGGSRLLFVLFLSRVLGSRGAVGVAVNDLCFAFHVYRVEIFFDEFFAKLCRMTSWWASALLD